MATRFLSVGVGGMMYLSVLEQKQRRFLSSSWCLEGSLGGGFKSLYFQGLLRFSASPETREQGNIFLFSPLPERRYSFSHNHGSGKWLYLKVLEAPIFDFHDYTPEV